MRRKPVVPDQLRHVLAFFLREHVHVAVAVVADVRVIQIGQRARFVRRADVPIEPVGHHDLPVRIGARHQQHDHVVQNLLHRRRVVGGELVDELDRCLRAADFDRVRRAGDEHDRLAVPEDFVAIARARRAVLEVQAAFQLLVAVEIFQRLGRRNLEGDERIALAGLSQIAEPDAVGSGRDELHVVDDLVPPRELVVGADLEPDKLFRRLERWASGREACRSERGRRPRRSRPGW